MLHMLEVENKRILARYIAQLQEPAHNYLAQKVHGIAACDETLNVIS